VSIAIIFYTLSQFNQIGQATGWGIIAAAVLLAIWNTAKLNWLWKYKPRKASFGRILWSLILVVLLACTVAAFTGVEPFSSLKDKVVSLIEWDWELTLHYKSDYSAGVTIAYFVTIDLHTIYDALHQQPFDTLPLY